MVGSGSVVTTPLDATPAVATGRGAPRPPAGARKATVGLLPISAEFAADWGVTCRGLAVGSPVLPAMPVLEPVYDPGARMKAQRDHRVPLSGRAVEILREASLLSLLGDGAGLAFPTQRGKALSDRTLSMLVREQGIAAVPHGFRSSFRDWASERTNHPREVIEAALAHVVSNQTEAAYARSDLFERRRQLMDDWMEYLAGDRGQVVAFHR